MGIMGIIQPQTCPVCWVIPGYNLRTLLFLVIKEYVMWERAQNTDNLIIGKMLREFVHVHGLVTGIVFSKVVVAFLRAFFST